MRAHARFKEESSRKKIKQVRWQAARFLKGSKCVHCMDTRSIVLEEITVQEFQEREKVWGDNRRINDQVLSSVQNPIKSLTYERLILELAETPGVRQLCVREGLYWIRVLQAQMQARAKELAKIAGQDRFKKNYLNVVIGPPKEDLRNCSSIEFAEKDAEIVGYKVRVQRAAEQYFTINARENWWFNNGLWVPAYADKKSAVNQ